MTLALIDYGAGNLHSVANALKAAGATDVAITADADVVAKADRIVLPGVGAFGACASALRAVPGMVDALNVRVRDEGAPFLGICVGMQLMADTGEEHGVHDGLGWIAGKVRLMIPADPAAKVPHMGWNDVAPAAHAALIEPGEAYFLHSYAFEGDDVIATSDHAGPVVAAIGRGNMIGVQFHPEKSQRYGLDFLRRFLAWAP
ncbi:imidazole glycerol phosphate synthase subunit HisH [Sphingomonas immobilis]|uniref:Imidazole glycerol phosphate synthase subunit HisH n=1 Tax=Sphingomonas immobilis TaxID=3063997 RepID=A0ABT9A4K1_9SPHN|nr:imidazole glycerol phosphate synthase subunit HisH [Sphingomonas sp. CA1-15]MDO7844145.1 imidazole glycerol phosphate synthase subunit HisH [Sphingomonas sp. CA1-15]